jgi:hypothetical protein
LISRGFLGREKCAVFSKFARTAFSSPIGVRFHAVDRPGPQRSTRGQF